MAKGHQVQDVYGTSSRLTTLSQFASHFFSLSLENSESLKTFQSQEKQEGWLL